MFDVDVTAEMFILLGLGFGLLMIAPILCSIVSESCKVSDPSKDIE